MQDQSKVSPTNPHTTMFIDCEFNSYLGGLISMAIVDERGDWWYRSIGCENPDPWVAEHVMPVINQAPISRSDMQTSLELFLLNYESIHLVADWPEDIQHFCALMITGPGTRIEYPPITMEFRKDLDAKSHTPHNALADALAIRDKYAELKLSKV